MVASSDHCGCDTCGTRCTGKFSGCRDVWAQGPHTPPVVVGLTVARKLAPHNGHQTAAEREPEPGSDPTIRILEILNELALGMERLAARQDELAARQDKLMPGGPGTEPATQAVQRQILAAQQETLASLTTHKLLLSAHQRALATLAAQNERLHDELLAARQERPADPTP